MERTDFEPYLGKSFEEIFAIYLEPVMSPGKPGQHYEAVFN